MIITLQPTCRAFLAAAALLSVRCAMAPMDAGSNATPQNPPLPRIESILPLDKGNHWLYSYSVYDTAGDMLFSRESLHLAMPHVFGIRNDTALTELFYTWADDSANYRYDNFWYAYEWEAADRGWLVTYRDLDVAVRGVYVVGGYAEDSVTVLDTPRLWLAYPADSGFTWTYQADTAETTVMTVAGTGVPFYFPDERLNGPQPLRFLPCYLYRETGPGYESWYYYNEDFGCVGFLRYESGRLVRSYILRQFERDGNYYEER